MRVLSGVLQEPTGRADVLNAILPRSRPYYLAPKVSKREVLNQTGDTGNFVKAEGMPETIAGGERDRWGRDSTVTIGH